MLIDNLKDLQSSKRETILAELLLKFCDAITVSDIEEIRLLPNPPAVVLAVLRVVFIALGHEDFDIARAQLKANQLNLLNSLRSFRKETLTYKKCKNIHNLI